jgi:hypothetical protein
MGWTLGIHLEKIEILDFLVAQPERIQHATVALNFGF